MTGPWRAWEIALTRPERFVVGLMSGTSVDGIDAALVRFDRETHFPELVTFRETPWRPEEREMLLAAAAGRGNAERVAHLHFLVGARFAEAVEELLRCSGIRADAVGNHGQTIAHRPPTPGGSGATLQIGCAASIARSSGCVVV
ncbi:MAG: anhydro-N-acetylmuramic acid kinase, partial [Armatimonadota bacterium]